ncbi:MFS transporter, partial [bacterium]|nr:MFS transporter [bacterium]
ALGAFVTALYLTWREPPRAQGKLVLASVAVYGLAIAAFAVVDSFALGLLLLAIYGVSDTVSMVIRNVVRQEVTPDELRGRMISVNMIFFIGGPQLGELEAGLLARFVGVRASVLWGGLACTIVALAYAIRAPWLRRHVRIPTGPAPAPSLIEKGEGKKEERAPSGPAA